MKKYECIICSFSKGRGTFAPILLMEQSINELYCNDCSQFVFGTFTLMSHAEYTNPWFWKNRPSPGA